MPDTEVSAAAHLWKRSCSMTWLWHRWTRRVYLKMKPSRRRNIRLCWSAVTLTSAGVLAIACQAGNFNQPAGPVGGVKHGNAAEAKSSLADPQAARDEIAAMNTNLQSVVRTALDDAARRTGRDASTLKVISSEVVTWSDGSLGCPEPGKLYTMALVPGYRIRIQASDQVLDYHASRRGGLVLCPPGQSVDPVPGGPT